MGTHFLSADKLHETRPRGTHHCLCGSARCWERGGSFDGPGHHQPALRWLPPTHSSLSSHFQIQSLLCADPLTSWFTGRAQLLTATHSPAHDLPHPTTWMLPPSDPSTSARRAPQLGLSWGCFQAWRLTPLNTHLARTPTFSVEPTPATLFLLMSNIPDFNDLFHLWSLSPH